MFTGIIEETGILLGIRRENGSARLAIGADRVLEGTSEGDSIAVNGVCLTVTSLAPGRFTADAMPETLDRSSLGALRSGNRVNLERAMRADGRFGGHIVSGHVDACGRVLSVTREGIADIVNIEVPSGLMHLIAEKGSVTVDGASLTVTAAGSSSFSVSLIPHTKGVTTLGELRPGSRVNVEADVLARYVARILSCGATGQESGFLTMESLARNGFI